MNDLHDLCRLCGLTHSALIPIIDHRELTTAAHEPNLQQKIRSCLSIDITDDDELPKRICPECCLKTQTIYEFHAIIHRTQKWLTEKCLRSKHLTAVNADPVIDPFHLNGISDKIMKLPNLRVQKIIVQRPKITESVPQVDQLLEKLQKSSNYLIVSKIPAARKDTLSVQSPIHLNNNQEPAGKMMLDLIDDRNIANKNDINNGDSNNEDVDNGNDQDDEEDSCSNLMNEIEQSINRNEKINVQTLDSNHHIKKPNGNKQQKFQIVQITNPAAYVCMTCKQKFSAFEPLKEHMQNSETCKQIHLTCEMCGKVFETKKSLYQHSLTHKEKNTFVCDECGKTYSNRFNLENHMSSVHGEQVEEYGSIYKCKVCDGQFTSRRELYAHINAHTKSPSVHLCDTCGKCFNSLEALRSHIRIHLDIRPFKCLLCDKRFRSRLQLTQHSHIHTGIKPFNCQTCGKAFAKKGSLVAHIRIHTGELPYECSICPQKFASNNKLKTHSKNH